MNKSSFEDLVKNFESPERDEWQKPQEVIKFLGDLKNKTVIDIGAGTGYFEFKMNEPSAKIIAADVDDRFIKYLNDRITKEQSSNISARKAEYEKPPVLEKEADVVFMVDVYHPIDNRKDYFSLVKKGLKLTKEQLYSINKASIKDAIIIFGGGCTGEIVSKEGLIFTNHHCGYGAIAAASTVDHNYLRDGFWSKSKSEEIYAPGVHAQFLMKIVDVTDKVNEKLKDIPALELTQKLPGILAEMATKETEGSGYEGRIASMFKANQFLLFVYERYKDVRLVGTPPESIGKFGGDTDNWEWPRHTGDFSIFRVYTNKEGKAADYAADNVPLKSKYSLPVSIKGVKDGDYTMIWGYPGGTNRYETSYGVKLKTDIENPSLVDLRDQRLKYMLEEMKKDPAVKIQLAGNYAQIANYWKFFLNDLANKLLKLLV
jgi:SAM-dependent methyltransferase